LIDAAAEPRKVHRAIIAAVTQHLRVSLNPVRQKG
jgi:hypothetical protein